MNDFQIYWGSMLIFFILLFNRADFSVSNVCFDVSSLKGVMGNSDSLI